MKNIQDINRYLVPTSYFDYEHPSVQEFAHEVGQGISDPIELAVAFYFAVRDQIRYNPYVFSSESETLSASYTLQKKETYCIPKAVLLGALARSRGIPARLGLADVRNHIASPQFVAFLRSNIFAMHGYIELYLENKWVKATPAFNIGLCGIMGVAPLDFNGREDSIFHEFTTDGQQHMEYLKEYGTFEDVPLDFILYSLKQHYPHLFGHFETTWEARSLEQDLEQKN